LAGTVIATQDLSLTFATNDGPVYALSKVDLTVAEGDFVSLIGPSGCGKTTLLRVIADLETATSGSITVNGMLPEQARLARAYGYVFQAPGLLMSQAGWRATSRWSTSMVSRKNIRGNCRAACNSGCRLRGLWRLTRNCC
jgi:ABC-type nitrate/sulfonate/bicarbonate transport system ATPase subunit